jgi:Sensors of blue-light using FAD
MLERLVYRSQATYKLGSLHLFNLLVQCRKRNLSLGITGHLLYTEEIFVQCIEGPSGSLDALWKSLQRDERHHSLELLSRGPISDRQFADWAMAFSSYAHFDKYDIPGFFPVDAKGMSSAADRCAQWGAQSLSAENDHATV